MRPHLPDITVLEDATNTNLTAWLTSLDIQHRSSVQWLIDLPNKELAPPTSAPSIDQVESVFSRKKRILPRPSDSEIGSLVQGALSPLGARKTADIVPSPLHSPIISSGGYQLLHAGCKSSKFSELDISELLSPPIGRVMTQLRFKSKNNT